MKKLILLTYIFLFSFVLLAQTDTTVAANPFLPLIAKPYAEYHDTYRRNLSELLHRDSLSRIKLLQLLEETAKQDPSGEWELQRQRVAYTVKFYESRDGGYVCSSDYRGEDYAKDMLNLAATAKKKGFPLISTVYLFHAAEAYSTFEQDYEQAFIYYLQAADELENVSLADLPPKSHIYNHLAGLYYTFREYDKAIVYYQKTVADDYEQDHYYKAYLGAMNGLGLCYRYGPKDYAMSDYYFKQILEDAAKSESDLKAWESIAKGNIGYNYYLQGELDTALYWLILAIEKFNRPNDFAFISGRAVNVASIYLKKNKTGLAQKYINMALDYHEKSKLPEKHSALYEVMSRYYTQIGDKGRANAYLDSTLSAVARENKAFSGLVLHRVEQKLRNADNIIHEQELAAEQARSKGYMYVTIAVSIALVLILFLLGLTLFFYNRKRNAYKELVRQSQRWAEIAQNEGSNSVEMAKETADDTLDTASIAPEYENTLEESDQLIMQSIEKAILEQALYKQADLTLDILSSQLGYSRYYISGALNRCARKNFNTYVNEYRVKEAIRLFSDPTANNMTIEGIAFEAGFNDRRTFHRVFKQCTGLTPGVFRANV